MERFESENGEKGEMQLAKKKPIQTPEPLEELLEKALDHLNKNGDLGARGMGCPLRVRGLMEAKGSGIFPYGCIQHVWESLHMRGFRPGTARRSYNAPDKKENKEV